MFIVITQQHFSFMPKYRVHLINVIIKTESPKWSVFHVLVMLSKFFNNRYPCSTLAPLASSADSISIILRIGYLHVTTRFLYSPLIGPACKTKLSSA